jgi:serine phosphatase RsbU (regulator of sigma subunit)
VQTPADGSWERVLAHVVDAAHLATGDALSELVDDAVRPVGLTAELLMVELGQRWLTPVRPDTDDRIAVEGTLAGRAYQLGEILAGTGDGGRVLWVPALDGTDRVGVLRVGLGDAPDDARLRRRLWSLAGLVGHVLMAKIVYSDRLKRWRTGGPLSPAAELLWQMLPPRTFATERVVVSALLEPHEEVAGDAYDYNVDGHVVDVAVFDAVGHDLRAGMTTALAITAIRNARRRDEQVDLHTLAAAADAMIAQQPGPLQFATAVLAQLDCATGVFSYLLAGHPAPLLVRHGKVVKELTAPPRPPLGVAVPGTPSRSAAREQLEPGDRLLLYSDGIVEARDRDGGFFGEDRLVELTEHAAASELSAPETLRRLATAVLEHQEGRLQDDATLLLVDWSADGHLRMFPTLDAPA